MAVMDGELGPPHLAAGVQAYVTPRGMYFYHEAAGRELRRWLGGGGETSGAAGLQHGGGRKLRHRDLQVPLQAGQNPA